jgi:hypothetical protein
VRNILIVLKSHLSKPDFESFVDSLGGKWNHDPTLDQGVLLRNAAAIYVDHFDPRVEYPVHEFRALERILGITPTAAVDIHIGHADGSEDLAYEFAEKLIDGWGGFLDENEHEIT